MRWGPRLMIVLLLLAGCHELLPFGPPGEPKRPPRVRGGGTSGERLQGHLTVYAGPPYWVCHQGPGDRLSHARREARRSV